jgi:hypothetical protein
MEEVMRPGFEERPHPMGGVQRLYQFPNGFGASVVKFHGSYGYSEGLWELAVITFHGPTLKAFHLCYDTPITDNVMGHLSESEVDDVLVRIEGLPMESRQ